MHVPEMFSDHGMFIRILKKFKKALFKYGQDIGMAFFATCCRLFG